jgi:hypothetical protein
MYKFLNDITYRGKYEYAPGPRISAQPDALFYVQNIPPEVEPYTVSITNLQTYLQSAQLNHDIIVDVLPRGDGGFTVIKKGKYPKE